MEHTHLVKGLNYVLLNKVRSEIDKKSNGGDDGTDGKSREIECGLINSIYFLLMQFRSIIDCSCTNTCHLFIYRTFKEDQ